MEGSNRYLVYATFSYAFGVIRPVERVLKKRGHSVAWFVPEGSESEHFLTEDDHRIQRIEDVIAYNPHAVMTSGNYIPHFFPGIKVQLFHGIDSGKEGEADIRGFFDLYCTQAPAKTAPFEEIHKRDKSFDFIETGWAKLDPLFTAHPDTPSFQTVEKQILFAPTFSPSMTCTYALYDQITELSKTEPWQWRVKFHPKVSREELAMYGKLQSDNFQIVDTPDVVPLLQAADVMLSDTSSIVTEFALLEKPVVTYRNLKPRPWMYHFTKAEQLGAQLRQAFNPSAEKRALIASYAEEVHPFKDGRSSERTVDAMEKMIASGTSHLARKPLNLLRKLKMRKKLGYWRLR